MPIEFDCPHCDSHLSLWDQLAGREGSCPRCKKTIVVPGPQGLPAVMACPKCAAEIPASSKICTQCGIDLKRGTKLETRVNEPGTVEKLAEESAGQLLDFFWRHKFIIAAVAIFFSIIIFLFSWASKKSIDRGQSFLEDGRPTAEQ